MIELCTNKNKVFLTNLLPTNNKEHILKVLKVNPYSLGFFLEVADYLIQSALERHQTLDEILGPEWLKTLGNIDDSLPDFQEGAHKARLCCVYQFTGYSLWDDCLNWENALLAESEASEGATHQLRSMMRLSARTKMQQRAKAGYWLIYFKWGFAQQVNFYEDLDAFKNKFINAFDSAS